MATSAPQDQMICLVTVDGIGFQQPPSSDGKVKGYADTLHERMRRVDLGKDLGDHPQRLTKAQQGPVYVQSNWPPFEGPTEDGLDRLGVWTDQTQQALVTTGKELGRMGARFC